MDDLLIMAGKLKAAGTPGTVRQIYDQLKANPPQPGPASNVQPKAIASDFMAIVTAEMDRTGKSYKDCYLKMRKAHPQIFDAWLLSVQPK